MSNFTELSWSLISTTVKYGSLSVEELVPFLQGFENLLESECEKAASETAAQFYDEINLLNQHIADLEDKVRNVKPTIMVKTAFLFDEAVELKDRLVDFIKIIKAEGVVITDAEDCSVSLYVAKHIAEFIFAYYGFKQYNAPSRGEAIVPIGTHSYRDDVVDAIKALLEFNYKGYNIVVERPY